MRTNVENSLVTEARLVNQQLLEDEVNVARGSQAPTLASTTVAANAFTAAAHLVCRAGQLQADFGLNCVCFVQP